MSTIDSYLHNDFIPDTICQSRINDIMRSITRKIIDVAGSQEGIDYIMNELLHADWEEALEKTEDKRGSGRDNMMKKYVAKKRRDWMKAFYAPIAIQKQENGLLRDSRHYRKTLLCFLY